MPCPLGVCATMASGRVSADSAKCAPCWHNGRMWTLTARHVDVMWTCGATPKHSRGINSSGEASPNAPALRLRPSCLLPQVHTRCPSSKPRSHPTRRAQHGRRGSHARVQVPTPIAASSGESERSLPEALAPPVSSGSLPVPFGLSVRQLLLLLPSADPHTAAHSLWAKSLSSEGQRGDIWRGRRRRPGLQ